MIFVWVVQCYSDLKTVLILWKQMVSFMSALLLVDAMVHADFSQRRWIGLGRQKFGRQESRRQKLLRFSSYLRIEIFVDGNFAVEILSWHIKLYLLNYFVSTQLFDRFLTSFYLQVDNGALIFGAMYRDWWVYYQLQN